MRHCFFVFGSAELLKMINDGRGMKRMVFWNAARVRGGRGEREGCCALWKGNNEMWMGWGERDAGQSY